MDDFFVIIFPVLFAGSMFLVFSKIEQYIDAKYKWKSLDFIEFESNPDNKEAINQYRLNPRSKKNTKKLDDCIAAYCAEILKHNTNLLRKGEQSILRFVIKRIFSSKHARFITPEENLAAEKHAFISNFMYIPLRKTHESDDDE